MQLEKEHGTEGKKVSQISRSGEHDSLRFQRFFLLPSVVLRIDHRIGSVPDESVISLLVAFDFQHIKGSPLLPPTSTNNGISHYYPALVASTAVFPLFITNFIDKIPPKRIANDTIRKYSEWEIYGRG